MKTWAFKTAVKNNNKKEKYIIEDIKMKDPEFILLGGTFLRNWKNFKKNFQKIQYYF